MPPSDRSLRLRLDALEREARGRARLHTARVFAAVALGYSYPILLLAACVVLVAGTLYLLPWVIHAGELSYGILYLALLSGTLFLAAAIVDTFRIRHETDPGCPVTVSDAPGLWGIVGEVCRATDGVSVDRVCITGDLNAGVMRRSYFGLCGPSTDVLMIGLPTLMALDVDQLRVVLAHEFSHLHHGHATLAAWGYRVNRTWAELAAPFQKSNRLRRLLMGWFIDFYGAFLARTTLPLRRRHEYEADGAGAEAFGAEATAEALCVMELQAYRLSKDFWPAVLRRAGVDPIPPSDVFTRMQEYLHAPCEPELAHRWKRRARSCRTPVTSDHPCLKDRLEALGSESILEGTFVEQELPSAGEARPSALGLLGECAPLVFARLGALWKGEVIERWRTEHAYRKFVLEKIDRDSDETDPRAAAERDWDRLSIQAEYGPPEQARRLLLAMLAQHPDHAQANLLLARMLLDQDDEQAIRYFEKAMSGDSDCILPSLQLLLDYYREAGRDQEADEIRERLERHENTLSSARAERAKVRRRDRFRAHELPTDKVERMRRALSRVLQIESAYLVQKDVRVLQDKPGYVLAVTRRSSVLDWDSVGDKRLINALQASLEQECAVVILSWRKRRLRSRILAACPSPIFVATFGR